MEEQLFEIISESFKRNLIYGRPSTIRDASEKAVREFKEFIKWKDNIKCDFSTCWNNDDPNRDKICYERNGKHYNLEHVWEYWKNHK